MRRESIGGRLTAAAYSLLANRHRPSDQQTLRAAALELQNRGLKPRDVAQAIGVSEAAVRALLERRSGL